LFKNFILLCALNNKFSLFVIETIAGFLNRQQKNALCTIGCNDIIFCDNCDLISIVKRRGWFNSLLTGCWKLYFLTPVLISLDYFSIKFIDTIFILQNHSGIDFIIKLINKFSLAISSWKGIRNTVEEIYSFWHTLYSKSNLSIH
jgi:hypothetical protein